MLLLSYLALTSMCSLSFLSHVLSLDCNSTQYPWPVRQHKFCCNKCQPGTHQLARSSDSCEINCVSCKAGLYKDTYNVEMHCEFCEDCNKPNMEYRSKCNNTHNAVCSCKAGYRCRDKSCKQCVRIPSTTKPTLPPSTTVRNPRVITTPWTPSHPIRDTVWFLVIITLLCAGLALVVVTNIKPLLRWIKARQSYYLDKEPVAQCSEEEDVCMPVQEVRGKCDV